jgi:hypothetical protein
MVFPVGDVEALSKVLLTCAVDGRALGMLGDNARQRVLEKYSMDVAVTGVLQALKFLKTRR